jgi:hypothetical protein
VRQKAQRRGAMMLQSATRSNCKTATAFDPALRLHAASSYVPQRGFLVWRLSDAGRRTSGAFPQAAGIRNPSQ